MAVNRAERTVAGSSLGHFLFFGQNLELVSVVNGSEKIEDCAQASVSLSEQLGK